VPPKSGQPEVPPPYTQDLWPLDSTASEQTDQDSAEPAGWKILEGYFDKPTTA
jgi:hypothetical protein